MRSARKKMSVEWNLVARRSERQHVIEFLERNDVQGMTPRELAMKIKAGVHLGLRDNGKPLLPLDK